MAAEAQKPSHRRDRLIEIQKWAQARWEASKVFTSIYRRAPDLK
jgi:hypothetical protein